MLARIGRDKKELVHNIHFRPLPQVTAPNWPAVVTRSLEMGTRASTLTALRHLYSMSEVARLKHGVTIEVRFVAAPGAGALPQGCDGGCEDDFTEAHGDVIWASNNLTRGAIFHFPLP